MDRLKPDRDRADEIYENAEKLREGFEAAARTVNRIDDILAVCIDDRLENQQQLAVALESFQQAYNETRQRIHGWEELYAKNPNLTMAVQIIKARSNCKITSEDFEKLLHGAISVLDLYEKVR